MRAVFFALISMLFIGCQKDKIANFVTSCPGEIPPALKMQVKEAQVILCGRLDPKSHAQTDGSVLMNDFVIYQYDKAGQRSMVASFDEKSHTLMAKIEQDKMVLSRLVDFGDGLVPYSAATVSCNTQGCQLSESQCRMVRQAGGFPKALDDIKPQLSGHNASFVKPQLLFQIAYEAHFGNTRAKEFLDSSHKKIPESSAWKPAYSSAQFFMQKLTEAGCK